MRVMVLVKATKDSESGIMPSPELFEAMGKFNEELVNAGIMLAGEGLHPSSKGKRIAFDGDKRTIKDGPFSATNELVAGFWILEVASREEAVQWARRCPIGPGVTLEVRRIAELSDLEGVAPAEVLDAEATLRRRVAERDQV